MQPGAGQNPGHLRLAHDRAEDFETLNQEADEVGELVDRLVKLYEGLRAVLVDPLYPVGNGAVVTRNARAVCDSDQPRAAFSSRMAWRSVGR